MLAQPRGVSTDALTLDPSNGSGLVGLSEGALSAGPWHTPQAFH